MSAVSRVSDMLVSLLGSTTFGVAFEARRAYRLDRDIRFSGVKITVIPDTLAISLADVTPRKFIDWRIVLWVQAITKGEIEDVDPLMDLMEDIAVLVAGKSFDGNFSRCIGVESIPPLDPDQLATKGLFLSGLFLTYRTART